MIGKKSESEVNKTMQGSIQFMSIVRKRLLDIADSGKDSIGLQHGIRDCVKDIQRWLELEEGILMTEMAKVMSNMRKEEIQIFFDNIEKLKIYSKL